MNFIIAYKDIPNISTPNEPSNYTSLKLFQDIINENMMVLPTPNTELGHKALRMKNSISLLHIAVLIYYP